MKLDELIPLLYVERSEATTLDKLLAVLDWVVQERRFDALDDFYLRIDPARMPATYGLLLVSCPFPEEFKNREAFIARLIAAAPEGSARRWVEQGIQLLRLVE